jgi:hypothetical protein
MLFDVCEYFIYKDNEHSKDYQPSISVSYIIKP